MQQGQQLNIQQAYQLAVQHQGQGNPMAAKQLLDQIVIMQPQHAHAQHLLGVVTHQLGNNQQAVQHIAKAIAMMPNEPLFHSNCGEMNRLLERVDSAIHHGEIAVKLNPTSASFQSNLGIAYYDNEELDKAEQHQTLALQQDPNHIPALNNLGSIWRDREDKAKAIEYYRKVIAINPNYVESLSNLGAVLCESEENQEAISILQRALQINPAHPQAHCNLAQCLIYEEDLETAMKAFQQAIQLKPDYAEAYIGKARIEQEWNQSANAETSIRKALDIDPSKPEAHNILGSLYIEEGHMDKAREEFDIALSLKDDSAQAIIGKGTIHMQLGEMELAEDYYNQALAIDPDDLSARISITQARKTVAGEENFLKLEEKIPELEDMKSVKAMPIHFALGKSYDDLKEYDKAFEHFKQGCAIKRSKIEHDADKLSKKVTDIIGFFTPEKLTALRGAGNSSDKPIFVLGMPRSGTTLTEQIISSHPQVYGAGELPDLLNIANTPLDPAAPVTDGFPYTHYGLTQEKLSELGNQYISQISARAPDSPHITDKMPANFFCVGLIHLMLPNAKIIHIKRNPVDTCISNFSKLFGTGQNHSYDMTELGRFYQDYHRLMIHWHEVIPTDNFMAIQYEDLVADNETKSKELIDFIGLEWDEACLNFHENKRQVRTASISQVRNPIYKSSVTRWKRYEKHIQPLLDTLGNLVPAD